MCHKQIHIGKEIFINNGHFESTIVNIVGVLAIFFSKQAEVIINKKMSLLVCM